MVYEGLIADDRNDDFIFPTPSDPAVENLETVIRKLERKYLNASLSQTNGNVAAASKLAGIARATFYKKLGMTDNHDSIDNNDSIDELPE